MKTFEVPVTRIIRLCETTYVKVEADDVREAIEAALAAVDPEEGDPAHEGEWHAGDRELQDFAQVPERLVTEIGGHA